MRLKKIVLITLFVNAVVGCTGSQETILPTDPLSPEQIEAIKAEDQAIDDEEGGQN